MRRDGKVIKSNIHWMRLAHTKCQTVSTCVCAMVACGDWNFRSGPARCTTVLIAVAWNGTYGWAMALSKWFVYLFIDMNNMHRISRNNVDDGLSFDAEWKMRKAGWFSAMAATENELPSERERRESAELSLTSRGLRNKIIWNWNGQTKENKLTTNSCSVFVFFSRLAIIYYYYSLLLLPVDSMFLCAKGWHYERIARACT